MFQPVASILLQKQMKKHVEQFDYVWRLTEIYYLTVLILYVFLLASYDFLDGIVDGRVAHACCRYFRSSAPSGRTSAGRT